jgi:hypothetical protein
LPGRYKNNVNTLARPFAKPGKMPTFALPNRKKGKQLSRSCKPFSGKTKAYKTLQTRELPGWSALLSLACNQAKCKKKKKINFFLLLQQE